MDSGEECPFDMLFKISVPHIPEKILLSLDYESFKRCLKVNKEWNKLLMTKANQRKAASIFREEALKVEEKLLCRKMKGAWITIWLRELMKLALILLILYSVYYLLLYWIMPHEYDDGWYLEYEYKNAKSQLAKELAFSNLKCAKEKQRLREASVMIPIATLFLPIFIFLFFSIGMTVPNGMDEWPSYRLKALKAVPALSPGIFGWRYKMRLEMLHDKFLRKYAKKLVKMYSSLRWTSLFVALAVPAVMLSSIWLVISIGQYFQW